MPESMENTLPTNRPTITPGRNTPESRINHDLTFIALSMAADYEAIANLLSGQPEADGPLLVPNPKDLWQDCIKSPDDAEIVVMGRNSPPLHSFPCPLPIHHRKLVNSLLSQDYLLTETHSPRPCCRLHKTGGTHRARDDETSEEAPRSCYS